MHHDWVIKGEYDKLFVAFIVCLALTAFSTVTFLGIRMYCQHYYSNYFEPRSPSLDDLESPPPRSRPNGLRLVNSNDFNKNEI